MKGTRGLTCAREGIRTPNFLNRSVRCIGAPLTRPGGMRSKELLETLSTAHTDQSDFTTLRSNQISSSSEVNVAP